MPSETPSQKPFDIHTLLEDNHWELPSDLDLLDEIAEHIEKRLTIMGWNEADLNKVSLVFSEAFTNAVVHGNAGLRREENESNDIYRRRAAQVARTQDKKVVIETHFASDAFKFSIRDEGPGFDHTKLPDALDPKNLLKSSGRGVFLIRRLAQKVEFNERGNKITVTIQRNPKTQNL